jgi:hypoxanthine phosphoribosyltransferase
MNWDEYEHLIYQLAIKLKDQKFDHILCVGRGGFMLGDALSRIFEKPLAVILARSYEEETQGKLWLSSVAAFTELKGRILIVDDLVDSGKTMNEIYTKILYDHKYSDIITATIWLKTNSSFKPDFYVNRVSHDEWITQPFEKFDGVVL